MITPLFLGGIGMQEILVILLIVLLFYGGKKVPEMMRGLGQGVKAFKDGMNTDPSQATDQKASTQPKEAESKATDELPHTGQKEGEA